MAKSILKYESGRVSIGMAKAIVRYGSGRLSTWMLRVLGWPSPSCRIVLAE